MGLESWGYVVAKLLRELPIEIPAGLVERGQVLDNFYVPARYPNGHPEGAPFEHYGPRQSEEAIEDASAIVEFVRSQNGLAVTTSSAPSITGWGASCAPTSGCFESAAPAPWPPASGVSGATSILS